MVLRDGDGQSAEHEVRKVVLAPPRLSPGYPTRTRKIVDKFLMPEGLAAYVRDFVEEHHEDEEFVKRRRDNRKAGEAEDGKGDPRIRQLADVYRAPRRPGGERLH